jgi:hypothetical protein
MPSHLGNYEHINTGVKYAKELVPEVVEVGGSPVKCIGLEVLYDRRGWQPEERSVKFVVHTVYAIFELGLNWANA